MDVFIHEDYVKKRNEVRREQRRKKVQMQVLQLGPASGNPGASSRPASACREESPRAPSLCTTPTGMSPSTVRSPAPAASPSEEAVSSGHRRLFDCLKPY
ncbi:uncharacterized protein [Lolium perenne]|uniref:uncharacterized protein n=1 Tax=Lolium perenne TaxID=4522 RepID=UPI0021F607DC|nr:uncharacterized protein LOC127321108 [Lolium perenne]